MSFKHTVTYRSDNILPDELDCAFETAFKRIQENRFEPDKVHLDLQHLRGDILRWFVKHRIQDGII